MHLPLVRGAWLAMLLCLAACSSPARRPDAVTAAADAPTLLLVSIDGLRADIPGSGRMPTLDALFAQAK